MFKNNQHFIYTLGLVFIMASFVMPGTTFGTVCMIIGGLTAGGISAYWDDKTAEINKKLNNKGINL